MGLSHGNRRSVYKGSCHLDENAAVIKMFCIFFCFDKMELSHPKQEERIRLLFPTIKSSHEIQTITKSLQKRL